MLVLFFMTPRTIVVAFQLKRHLISTCDNITNQTLCALLTDAYNAIRGHEYTKAVALYKKCIMNVLQECIDEEKSLRCQSSSTSHWYNPPWQPWNPEPLMEINGPILSIFPLMEDSPQCTWCQSTTFTFCWTGYQSRWLAFHKAFPVLYSSNDVRFSVGNIKMSILNENETLPMWLACGSCYFKVFDLIGSFWRCSSVFEFKIE